MLKIGHRGWITVNLGQANFTEPFKMTFERRSPALLDFIKAADYTAQCIASTFDNLMVCLSGGYDSEFVAATLIRNKIDFTPVIILTPFNQYETWFAQYFCATHGLTPEILDYSDIERYNGFVQKLLIKAKRLDVMPFVALFPNLVADLYPGSKLITGFGDPLYISESYNDPIGDELKISDHDSYFELEFNDHPGAFFTYTPEILLSLVSNIDSSLNSQQAKAKLYGLSPRPKIPTIIIDPVNPNISSGAVYLHQQLCKRYTILPEDRFTQTINKCDLISQLK